MDSLPNWLSHNELYNIPSIDIIKENSDDPTTHTPNDRTPVATLEAANVIGSRFNQGPHELHKVLLDIDVPHVYKPSRTPDHGHLILNVNVTRPELVLLQEFLVALGISGRGNLQQVIRDGQNFLRTKARTPIDISTRSDPFY